MYNVVFVYTKEAGRYEGVRWWTSFRDEKSFLEWYFKQDCVREMVLVIDGIMKKGVTNKEAIELCRQTTVGCLLNAIIEDFEILKKGLKNI